MGPARGHDAQRFSGDGVGGVLVVSEAQSVPRGQVGYGEPPRAAQRGGRAPVSDMAPSARPGSLPSNNLTPRLQTRSQNKRVVQFSELS